MTRINIHRRHTDGTHELLGWFNLDKAARFHEDTYFDGQNHISEVTGSQFNHEALLRTSGGRWVLHAWSDRIDADNYQYVTDSTAQKWLTINQHDEALTEHFGGIEEEDGPNIGGRPNIGAKVEVRLTAEALADIDTRAVTAEVSRAEMLRRLIATGLASA